MEIEFRHPLVRDLAWVMASPSLLASRPELVSDAQCQSIIKNHFAWLREQDKTPEQITQWLDGQKSHRLGYYFEYLVAYWLKECIADRSFDSHVRVFDLRRTIGEFDFLFQTDNDSTLVHWETTVKFYLYYQAEDEKVFWCGPNAHDRLDIKMDRVFNHQLTLGNTPQGKKVLHEFGFDSVRSQTFFKGYLFYPVTGDWRHPQNLPEYISSKHLRGWWSKISELHLPDCDSEDRWIILTRLEWLAPRVFRESQCSRLIDKSQLLNLLQQHFDSRQQPVLLVQMEKGVAFEWQEKTRGFIVGGKWPNVVEPAEKV